MKLKFIAIATFLICCAAAQQILPVTQQQGATAPPAGNCAYLAQVGNFWNQISGSTNPTYICQQTGNGTLPSFGWVPLSVSSGSSTGTISVAAGKAAVINNSLTFAGTDGTTMTFPGTTDTVVTLTATQTLTNKTLTAPVIATISNTGTLTLPTSTDTLVGRATTDTLTNKTLTSPTMTTPTLGVATATSIIGLTAASTPNAAGGTTIGSAALPFSSVFVGGAATNNLQLTGTATAARVVTFPDASITVPGTVIQNCGTTSTCSATNVSTTSKVVSGAAPLVSGTPSTVTITGFSPAFTSTTSYACAVTNQTNAANSALKVVNTSASSITVTGPNTLTDTIGYVCVGS